MPARSRILPLIRAEAKRLSGWLQKHPGAQKLMAGTVITKDEYAHFLSQTYHYIRWTATLLEVAAKKLRAQRRYPDVAALMEAQAREKAGQERRVLADLLALGYDEDALRSTGPSPAVKAYLTWNHYAVQGEFPLALLGTAYVLGLLSLSHASDTAQKLVRANVIPGVAGAVTWLSEHAQLDPHHVPQIEQAILQVAEPEDLETIYDSARNTRAHYLGLFAGPPAPGSSGGHFRAGEAPRSAAAALASARLGGAPHAA